MRNERVEIKLSKTKGIMTFSGSAAFVAMSLWLINLANNSNGESIHLGLFTLSPITVLIVGYIGLIFFGFAGLYIFYKLFDSKPGLILDTEGIHDNSSAAAVPLIPWESITGFRPAQVMSTKFILIDIKDPEHFMNDAGGLKKRLMQGTYKMYGTPLSIASTTLSCDFDELLLLLKKRLNP